MNNITTDRAGNSTKGVVSREVNTGEYKSKSRGFGYKRVDGSSSRLSPVGGVGAKGQATESRESNGKSDAKAESSGSDRLKAFKTPRANNQSMDNSAGATNTWKPMDRSSSGALQGQSTKGVRSNRLQPFDQPGRLGVQNTPGIDNRGKSAQPGTSTRLRTATPKRTSPPTSTPKATKSSTPPKSSKASSASKAPKKESRPAPAKKAPPKKASKGKKSDK